MSNPYALPDFLVGVVTPYAYARWLQRKAVAHVRRDRARDRPCTVSAYKHAIHAAVQRSGGHDAYTGEALDWSLISTYRNEESQAGRHAYKAGFALLPTVDHVDADVHGSDFNICAWRTNDAKNDLSLAAFRDLCARVVDRASIAGAPPMDASPPQRHAARFDTADAGAGFTIDQVIEQLARHRQRATYGALAGVVGGLARSIMGRHSRTPRNSWIVSAATGEPTGYAPHERAPELLSRDHVINTPDALLAWLRSPK